MGARAKAASGLAVVAAAALAGACKGKAEQQKSQRTAASERARVLDAGRVASPDDAAAPAIGADGDLVDVAAEIPSIAIDLRYATTDNFMKENMYGVGARCLLRRRVARQLALAQASLQRDGLGLKLWDCYRPFHVQQKLWGKVSDPRYVARPVARDGVPVEGSRHNRGAAVDLTLLDASGVELAMPTDYDDFSDRAHRDATGIPEEAAANAALLESAMVAAGFEGLPTEWWHFDGRGWREFPLADEPLVAAPDAGPTP